MKTHQTTVRLIALLALWAGGASALLAQAPDDPAGQPPATQPTADEGMSARVLRVVGKVTYALTDANGQVGPWQAAKADDLLPAGTQVRTSVRSHLLLKFGDDTPTWVGAFYGGAVVLWVMAGALAGAHLIFFLAAALVALQLAWQVTTLDIRDGQNCLRRFKSNRDVGVAIFIGLVADMSLSWLAGLA